MQSLNKSSLYSLFIFTTTASFAAVLCDWLNTHALRSGLLLAGVATSLHLCHPPTSPKPWRSLVGMQMCVSGAARKKEEEGEDALGGGSHQVTEQHNEDSGTNGCFADL